jgi:hypothetical protein
MKNDKMELYNSRFFAACKEGRLERIKHYIQVKFKDFPQKELNVYLEKGIYNVAHTFSQKHIESFEYLQSLYPNNVKNIVSYRNHFIEQVVEYRNFKMIDYLINKDIVTEKKDIETKIGYLSSIKDCNSILIKLINKDIINLDDKFTQHNLTLLELACQKVNIELVKYIVNHHQTDCISNLDYYKNLFPVSREEIKEFEKVVKNKEKEILEHSLKQDNETIKEGRRLKL